MQNVYFNAKFYILSRVQCTCALCFFFFFYNNYILVTHCSRILLLFDFVIFIFLLHFWLGNKKSVHILNERKEKMWTLQFIENKKQIQMKFYCVLFDFFFFLLYKIVCFYIFVVCFAYSTININESDENVSNKVKLKYIYKLFF